MGLSITGYVLEPPRVGQANSPFTFTPNVYISNQAAFDVAYPTSEANPPTQYHVVVMQDGDLPDAVFGWTKNEVIQRFDYQGQDQRFKVRPGSAIETVGVLGPDSNTTRIQVIPPISSDFVSYPARVSVGTDSGTSFTISLVLNDGSFGSPGAGTVELSLATGNLNWNAGDLTTFGGQDVRFQRQTFFPFTESNGRLGVIDDVLLLNPLPGTGQYPLIRIGFGEFLTPIEVPNDAALLPAPASGSVKWSAETGRLQFDPGDVAVNTGRFVYYEGVLFDDTVTLTPVAVGTLTAPGVLFPVPPEESDTFFRVPGVVQFGQTRFVDTLSTNGKRGIVEVRRSDGQVRFSSADQATYGAVAAQAITADLDIERGMSLSLYRTPVDPTATDPTLKDVSAYYESTDATLADPIIAAPFVTLPAIPVDTLPLTVKVINQGGTIITLPRLDVPSPPVGIGYVIDYEERNLLYAQRKDLQVIPAPSPYGAATLPDPLVFSSNITVEIEDPPNSGTYVPLTLGEDALLDGASGTISLVSTDGTLVVAGSGGAFLGITFTDLGQDFTVAGVLPGDLLLVRSGASIGVYTITAVGITTLTTDLPGTTESNLVYDIHRGEEILADRFFKQISPVDPNTKVERVLSLGTTTNSPRFSIPLNYVTLSRFRFGASTFSTMVNTVPDDSSFTLPASLPAGTVEVSIATGNLNFSQADVTAAQTVFWVRTLTLGTDYTLQAPLGFIDFSDRFLALEEAIITYVNANDPDTVIVEPGTFLVRKEVTQDHPTPTNTLFFNPLGRAVASNPPARVFRGGRPQVTNEQVTINTSASSIMFLADSQVTDALPHGPIVGPTERVYIDYYVLQAVGGEKSITVIHPPMASADVNISSDTNNFQIAGDRTSDFLADALLRVSGDKQELYLIGSVSYDSGTDTTTVTLAGSQLFLSDVLNPGLAVTSGPTRIVPSGFQPAYFITEIAAFQSVPRGASKIRIVGNLVGSYAKGRVVFFTDAGSTFTDFYQVDGSEFKEDSGFTEVTLSSSTARQYDATSILKRSIRVIFESSTRVAQTSRSPVLTTSYTVYRRIEGQVGVILSEPSDFQIDDSGIVVFTDGLQDNESWNILYTGYTIAQAGQSLRASYTFQIVPSEANGLLGSSLFVDYTTYAPDSFFWRVESFTNFRGELATQYTQEAQASIPSGGPILSNSSAPQLKDQGRESLYFQENHLANEDIVARATIVFYNDAINYLEDCLQDMDGRVVGDQDGRFLFDGFIDNPDRTSFDQVTNQIDDRFKISPAPYEISFPPFSVTSIGTFRAVYLASKTSRFFPTSRRRYGVTVDPSGLETGDSILDTQSTNLSSASKVQRRSPWAMVVRPVATGDTTIYVDDVDGAEDLLRTAFAASMEVQIADSATVYEDPLTILSVNGAVTPHEITFTGGVSGPIPIGASVFLSTADETYRKFYRVGTDVGVDLEAGQLTHIEPFPPLDGSVPAVPSELWVQNPAGGEVLDLNVTLFAINTAPDRFPALDGAATDDDGDRKLPLVNPSTNSEAAPLNGVIIGHLGIEESIIQTGTGTLRVATTGSFVDIGSLDGTGTVITGSGIFPASVKIYDLVRILTGVNGPSSFHQIVSVLGSTVTVTPPFTPDAGFTYTITASPSLVTSALGAIAPLTTLTDGSVDFVAAGVLPGHTVVITTGGSIGERRQVLTVAPTVLTVTPGFSVIGAASYRVDDALGTFGGPGSIQDQLVSSLFGELEVLDTNAPPDPYSEREAIERFYDTVFTDIVVSATGATTIGLPTFTDLSADFSEVTPEDFVYIRSGTVAGVYKVQTVTTTTTLDVETNFPATALGVSYRIVSSTGATRDALQALFGVLQDIDTFITSTSTFLPIVNTFVAVLPDVSAFARGLLTSDLDAREPLVSARVLDLNVNSTPNGSTGTVSAVLSSGDRFYDRRYTWIDARINMETGILVKQSRAITNRIKAEADIVNQLTKLLTV